MLQKWDQIDIKICFLFKKILWCLWNSGNLLGALFIVALWNWHCLVVWGTPNQRGKFDLWTPGPSELRRQIALSGLINHEATSKMTASSSFQKVNFCAFFFYSIGSFILIIINLAFFFFPFIFISWRLITLQHYSGFCHTLTWISHGFTCVPHPDPPSVLY